MGFIHVAFMIGAAISSFIWGIVADLQGRKIVLVLTLIADFIVTALCALMPHFYGIVICR